jgi:CubicO group peptidase (beta-lactamase class C family)
LVTTSVSPDRPDGSQFSRARALIEGGVHAHAYPAAVVEVGRADGAIWGEAFGRLTYASDAPPATPDTIFDLASLTKVIAAASIAMEAVEARQLVLDDPLSRFLPAWHGADRAGVTLRHLLDHSSGLPAHARLFEHALGRHEFERAICAMPLDRAPGTAAVYSDLGFILLGFALEQATGRTLDEAFGPIAAVLPGSIGYRPAASLVPRIAPTEHDPRRGRLLQGEVHDENAAALGGVAAHAGLFGTAGSVAAFARLVLATFSAPTRLGAPALMREFASRSKVPGSSRALAWDTMRPASSCGTLMAPTAIGHTGFTGTSLWIDYERDLYVVLLTNRVHPTRANAALPALRPAIHDAIVGAL